MLPILLEISAPHPGLSLPLTFTDTTIDPLAGGADLMIRFGPLPDSSHLVARCLVLQDRVICASPDYLRRHGRPRSLAHLKAHRVIVGSREGPPSAWVVRDNGVEKRITPPPAHEMSDGEAMVDAAFAGFGMVQMPASLVRNHIEEGRLVRVLEDVSPGAGRGTCSLVAAVSTESSLSASAGSLEAGEDSEISQYRSGRLLGDV